MNALTREWLQKAEGDFGTARRELDVPEMPNPDAVCYHAQQGAERCAEARLLEREHSLTAVVVACWCRGPSSTIDCLRNSVAPGTHW